MTHSSDCQGSTSGSGTSNNAASASNTNIQSIFGNFQQSNTNAISNQNTRPCFFNC